MANTGFLRGVGCGTVIMSLAVQGLRIVLQLALEDRVPVNEDITNMPRCVSVN